MLFGVSGLLLLLLLYYCYCSIRIIIAPWHDELLFLACLGEVELN